MAQRVFVTGFSSRPQLNTDGSISLSVMASYVDTNGLQYEDSVPVTIGISDTVGQIGNAVSAAVIAHGTTLGFTVNTGTIVSVSLTKI